MENKQSLPFADAKRKLIFTPLGGIGDVTKNMYLYEYQNDILIVDCGVGFPDETIIGVDLIVPDVSYLIKNKNKIRGMVVTHGHEDHFGALPYILPQLPPFPIFATRLTAAFANEKLFEFGITGRKVQPTSFEQTVNIGQFSISFVRVTHSVLDSANLIIKTPAGTFYHASDFKLDPTPIDNQPTQLDKIKKAGEAGVLCLLSDCLRIEKAGKTPSEKNIEESFEKELANCPGKFILTTYSSNVSRLNQAVKVARKFGRKVCFIGRSLIKAKEIATDLGYMEKLGENELLVEAIKHYPDNKIALIVAGSQGQENSAMVRIANDEDKFVKIKDGDVVVFSADSIPGNEVAVNFLVDTLSKKGARVVYSALTDTLHVSGHGSRDDIAEMIQMTKPRFLIPIGGSYRHMVGFRLLAQELGFAREQVILAENGQQVVFGKDGVYFGSKIKPRNIYIDEITGEEVEGVVMRDRQKLAKDGVVVALVSQERVEFLTRGFLQQKEKQLFRFLRQEVGKILAKHKKQKMDFHLLRGLLSEKIERVIFKKTGRRPLVLPIVVEV